MSKAAAFEVSVYAAGTKHERHEHETLQVSLVLRGGVTETVNGVTENGRALSVVAKNPGVAHADYFGPGAKLARLTFPSVSLTELVDEHGRGLDWRWTHDPRVAHSFVRLAVRAKDESIRSFESDDADVVDMLAAFTARPADAEHRSPPKWLSEVMDEVRSDWSPQLKVADIAARAGVHPVYLARCIRRWYGTTLSEELRRLRLISAAAALSESDGTVSRVAHKAGFSDEPHLCRDFRQTTGITPRRFRSLVDELS